MTFTQKLQKREKVVKSWLCVGLDSDYAKLSTVFRDKKYPQLAFNRWIIEQTHDLALAYKPNLAFYEARGTEGIHELELTMQYLAEHFPTIVTIADAKRADIDSTNSGYVKFLFDRLGFDAVTLHPYLGREALVPFLSRKDKGCIILCKTSNSGSGEFQDLRVGGKSQQLWMKVAAEVVGNWNQNSNCALVVGATYPKELAAVRTMVGEMPLLVPGVGAQGGSLREVLKAGLTTKRSGLIINASRGIIFAKDPRNEAEKMVQEMCSFR